MNKIILASIAFFLLILNPLLAFSQADLAVMNISISPENPSPGENVQINTLISNLTDFTFKGNFVVRIMVDGKLLLQIDDKDLKAKGSKSYSAIWQSKKGLHKLTVVLDTGSDIDLNTLNNIESKAIIIETPEERYKKELAKLPDLVCVELERPPRSSLAVGRIVIFKALFHNNSAVPILKPVSASWTLNDQKLGEVAAKHVPANARWNFRLKWRVKKGRHTLLAIVDSKNEIKEREEKENNTCELRFTVHPPENTGFRRTPRSRFIPYYYLESTEAKTSEHPYIEEIKITPGIKSGSDWYDTYNVEFVVYNPTGLELLYVTITVIAENDFTRSFTIEKLSAGERKAFSFQHQLKRGKLLFKVFHGGDIFHQMGRIVREDKIDQKQHIKENNK